MSNRILLTSFDSLGEGLNFSLEATDTSLQKDFQFSFDNKYRGFFIDSENTPNNSTLRVWPVIPAMGENPEVELPDLLNMYLPNGIIRYDVPNLYTGDLPAGIILRIKVTNGNPAAAFNVHGVLILERSA